MGADLRFPAMGTWAHVIVNGGRPGLAERARERIDELEQLWSRFLPGSELSRLNASAGTPMEVSDETLMLVRRGVQGWHRTGGLFDPTLLGAVVRAGYDRDFSELDGGRDASRASSVLEKGCGGIVIRGRAVLLPAGTGFDSGGLGKGLAADLVAHEIVSSGADGACVNLGGDLRVVGTAPGGGGWTLAVDHPGCDEPVVLAGLARGGMATSTTLLRRWTASGETRHHLIDPVSGQPSRRRLELVSVVAPEGWLAEVLTKAVMLGAEDHLDTLLHGTGAEALAVDTDGKVSTSSGFAAFLGDTTPPQKVTPRPLPVQAPDSDEIPRQPQSPTEMGTGSWWHDHTGTARRHDHVSGPTHDRAIRGPVPG